MTDMTDTLTIPLSERRPVQIDKSEWPLIASADWHAGEHKSQASEVAYLRVRQHADGRTLVYGDRDSGPGGMRAGYRATHGGYLLVPHASAPESMVAGPAGLSGPLVSHRDVDPTEIVRAIRRVAGAIALDDLGSECVAALPAESL